MQKSFRASNNIRQLYGKFILLFFLSHIIFTCIFIAFEVIPLFIYNLLSCLFYAGLYFIVQKHHFRLVVCLVHLEISVFTILCFHIIGWGSGFQIYMIALSTLVYFCPFKRKYIPYFFSGIEVLIFLIMKIVSINHMPLLEMDSTLLNLLFIYNSICSFGMIIYASSAFKVSATTMEETLTQDNSRLQDMVDHDTLTHLWSRSCFMDNYHNISAGGDNIILVMTDIDDFKSINDTYGHECGDYILAELSNIIRSMCPDRSGICRWGGEEFVLMFYGIRLDLVTRLVEQIRIRIANYVFVYENNHLHVTMTFGLCSNAESKNLQELINIADQRMYTGKRNGKNVVITIDNIKDYSS